MSDLWLDLFEKNRLKYAHASPKRGKFIQNYFQERGLSCDANNSCFLELGAFSGKDSIYLKSVFSDATFYLSDLSPEILKLTRSIESFAGDVFSLPLRNDAVDISFHSGLIILFNNQDVKRVIDSQNRVTRKYSFVFGLNKFNFVDHIMSFYKYKIKGDELFRYRRFTKSELCDMVKTSDAVSVEAFYHDNMVENFSRRHDFFLLKVIAKLFIFKLPFFYNEVVLVMKKKCVG